MTPIERNRVNITFTMNEGEAARISSLRIGGNSVFSESTLLDEFELSPTGWFSWYTKNDRYSRSKAAGIDEFPGFSIGVFKIRPESRGSIHIKSADPLHAFQRFLLAGNGFTQAWQEFCNETLGPCC